MKLLSLLLLLGIASKCSALWNKDHICDKIKDNTTNFALQAMFVDSADLCIIESDNLYRIPKVNLDQTNQVFKMYDREGVLYQPTKWYEHSSTKFTVKNPSKEDEYRYRERHSANVLKLYNQLIWTSESNQNRYLRSYQFYDNAQFLFRENDQSMPMDTLRDCEKEANSDVCKPQHRHSMFHAVIDGFREGYIFYYDQVDSFANNRKRVLVGALHDNSAPQEDDQFKLPEDNAKDNTVKETREGFYLKIDNNNRLSMRMVHSTDRLTNDGQAGTDYFKYLPFGFISGNTTYLVSLARKRVYFTAYASLVNKESLNFDMKSKPLKEFFICDSATVLPLQSTDATDETDQADYLIWASKFDPDSVEATTAGWIASMLCCLPTNRLTWLVIVALICIIACCCCFVSRARNKKKMMLREMKQNGKVSPFPNNKNKKANSIPKNNNKQIPKVSEQSEQTKSLDLFGSKSSSNSSSNASSTEGSRR